MVLVHNATLVPVKTNERVNDFRGEPHIVVDVTRGQPRHPGSTGRVLVRLLGSNRVDEYYPGVFDLKWINE